MRRAEIPGFFVIGQQDSAMAVLSRHLFSSVSVTPHLKSLPADAHVICPPRVVYQAVLQGEDTWLVQFMAIKGHCFCSLSVMKESRGEAPTD